MKKFKVCLSIFMVLVMVSISVAPSLAKNVISTYRATISADLVKVMENSEDGEKIKVYIWYKDIDQDEVDALTTKETGLTPESCSVIKEFPSQELLNSLENGSDSAKVQMDEYMERTKASRDAERELTDTYTRKRRQISNEKYNKKSRDIRNALSISDSYTTFSSQFAPMIIAEMTKEEIESAANNINIESLSLYYDYEVEDPSNNNENLNYTDNGKYAKKSMNLKKVYDVYELTGQGVNVGVIESKVPGSYDGDSGIDWGYDFSDITIVDDPDYPIIIDTSDEAYGNNHVNNTIRVMKHREHGIAKNINVYATNHWLQNVEALLNGDDYTIDVLEVNISNRVKDRDYDYETDYNSPSSPNPKFAYLNLEKYYDHVVATHGVTTVIAGGNDVESEEDYFDYDDSTANPNDGKWCPGARVTEPGMAYNAITVSGYDNKNNCEDGDDFRCEYCWKNSYISLSENVAYYGCEKPDVIMPRNFYHGGTSEASPALTAQIALMLELKPSLSLYPQAVKAIVLASCHRKVNSSVQGEAIETMDQGITERQGAGAPDAWAMISIVCQGTYGVGEMSGQSTDINIVQPPYGASHMNVSIAWLKENGHLDGEDDIDLGTQYIDEITETPACDLNLQVLRSDNQNPLSVSSLAHSSTEMCYVELSNTHHNYQIKINNNSNAMSRVRYGYAWSTDQMRAYSNSVEGVYYLKNASSGRYVTYESSSGSSVAQMRRVSLPTAFNKNHQWILKQSGAQFNLIPGNATTMMYLGQSTTQSGTALVSQLNSIAEPINILYNNDGTVSFLNSTNNRILSYSSSNLVWNTYNNSIQTPTTPQKWYLEKVNYLKGDVNADGVISVPDIDNSNGTSSLVNQDVIDFQAYISQMEPSTNLNMFLAEVDGDGITSILDIDRLLYIAQSQYNY